MMAKLRKFFLISRTERRLFLKAGFWLTMMRMGLWLVPFRNLVSLVNRLGRSRKEPPTDPGLVEQIAWAVNAASTFVPRSTCLTRALAAQIILKQNGCAADLRIGVASENGQFKSHAWIESHAGVIIGGGEHENYVPFEDIGLG